MTAISIVREQEEVSKTELAYAIGSYFWISTGVDEKHLCVLVRVDPDRVALIHTESCNRFAETVRTEAVFAGQPLTSISKIVEAFRLGENTVIPVKSVKIVVS